MNKYNLTWNPDIYLCPTCKTEVYSTYSGHFQTCACYKNNPDNLGGFVDQTHWYTRIGGHLIPTGKKLYNDS
jgi:hypothetical protein